MRKAGWLKNGTATPRGIVDKNGKLLKSKRMSQEEIDAFNGVEKKAAPKPAPAPVVEEPAPVVEVKEVEVTEAPKKKTSRKKKGGMKSLFGSK